MARKKRRPRAAKKHTAYGVTFKSSFEREVAEKLTGQGVRWEYEPDSFEYTTTHKYTPDFKVYNDDGSYYYIETKGYFPSSDRTKMAAVVSQHPELDIRMLFQRPSTAICNKAKKKTTYAEWAEKHGICA